MQITCLACNGPLKPSQISAMKLLYNAGFQGVKARCEKCDKSKQKKEEK
jgi:hypothetical protein